MKLVMLYDVVEYVGVFYQIVFCVVNQVSYVFVKMWEKVEVVMVELNYIFNCVV